MNQEELVEGLKSNTNAAYSELIKLYQKPIRNVCMGIVIHPEIAEEIAQDVFIEVFKSIHSFRAEAKLSTWMYRMAVNKSLNYVRSQKRHGVVQRIESFFFGDQESKSMQIENTSTLNPLQELISQEEMMRIENSISKLPDNQRTAFGLHKFDDLSYKEIAVIMDLSLSSVESLIHRAKIKLQKSILK